MTAYGREEVLLHTVWSDNILANIWSVNLPFSPHFISYQMEQVTLSLITYLDIPTYPHSLALRGTLALYEFVWSASHSSCITVRENAEYNLNRRLDGPEICPEALTKWKSLDPARNLTSTTHSSIQATDCQPHQLHYHSYPSTVSLILNICVTAVTDCLYSSHFLFMKKWIWKLYENGLQ